MIEDEEKLQLRADVERFKRMIRQKDEMIEEMEHELTSKGSHSTCNSNADDVEKELKGQLRDLQIEMDSRDATISKKDETIDELRSEIDKLEKFNRELSSAPDVTADNDDSNQFLESEMVRISEELEKYQKASETLLEANHELQKEALKLKEDHEMAVEHLQSLESHIKTRDEEIQRLESEVFDLKNSTQGKHAARGNSMFAEAMEHEQKLEEDLRTVYREKLSLQSMVKRLMVEKEDAEERARSAACRNLVVRTAVNHIDLQEMRRLRTRVHQLETERVVLWDRLFIKMRSVPKKELGSLFVGYFESFKCSMASVKGNHDEVLKKNEEYVTMIRGLQQNDENQRVQIEQLKFDVDRLERKLRSATTTTSKEDNEQLLREPLKPMNQSARPSFFVKPKRDATLSTPMSAMRVTPSKPANVTTSTSTSRKDETSEWAERMQKSKMEKKNAATPATQYNFVKLAQPKPRFKPGILKMPTFDED